MNKTIEAVRPKRSVPPGDVKSRRKAVSSRTAVDIKPRKVEWLWPGLVPFGAITVLSGRPGLGKSLLTVKLAADFSAGRLEQSGHVLMLTAEDLVAEVVVPRLKAARAELSAVHFSELEADGLFIPMRFPEDTNVLRDVVGEHEVQLVVIDPLSAHLDGRVDSWKDQSIRAALAPLAALAEERRLAVLVVAHLNKGQSTDPLQRLGGSIGLSAAARSVLLLGRDPDDPKGETGSRRVLAHVKSNFGIQAGSLAFRIKPVVVEGQYATAEIVAGGTSPYRGSDLLLGVGEGGPTAVMSEAVTFLQEALADGPRHAKDLEADASQAGIPWETVKKARNTAGALTRKQRGVQNGPWIWELASTEPEPAEQPAA